ncbi:hypothetical protein nbrc107696_07090 [Gordonia spumicola]|uniref:Uncharacterized protein n=1 Tax=Gordonia spumicola TaxID=589161 RepID=A0A7I9V4Z4_9ACTN|nr:hypothetical protein nbrc107696_07090 [Gordonia spumicola]
MASGTRRHVLITFARSFLTLNLARLMAAAGHQVTVVDSLAVGVSRYSNAVSGFHKVSPPKFKPQEYCRELAAIVEREKVDIVIPIHEETDILAMMAGLFPDTVELNRPGFDGDRFDRKGHLFHASPIEVLTRVAGPCHTHGHRCSEGSRDRARSSGPDR